VAAFAMYKEGLLPTNKMKLVTFGSPRALKNNESDQLHDRFLQYRLVYESDPIASTPPHWLGFKHLGTPFRFGGTLGRDDPRTTNVFRVGDHSKYEEWLGIN
jgi:hypothetical protein